MKKILLVLSLVSVVPSILKAEPINIPIAIVSSEQDTPHGLIQELFIIEFNERLKSTCVLYRGKINDRCSYQHIISLNMPREVCVQQLQHLSPQQIYLQLKSSRTTSTTDAAYKVHNIKFHNNTEIMLEAVCFDDATCTLGQCYSLIISTEEFNKNFAQLSEKETYEKLKTIHLEVQKRMVAEAS